MTAGHIKLDPRTPVIVGQAQIVQHVDDLEKASGPIELMSQAVSGAFSDAGGRSISHVDALHVVRSISTRMVNPALRVATAVGITSAEYGVTPHGGNMPQYLVNSAAQRIQNGSASIIILTGGEAMRSRRRARAADVLLPWMEQPSALNEESAPLAVGEDLPMNHEIEIDRKTVLPIEFYPLFESALRKQSGRSIAEHQVFLSELWSRFSVVAATNPHAWSRTEHSPEAIRTPTPTNRMIGFPYPKLMNSNNDVDMAAALIICSVEQAKSLGINSDKWVFIHAATDCHEHNFVSHRYSFTETPAIRLGGQLALQMANKSIDDIAILDLYSCFPSAVQLGARALGIALDRQLTCTGGLSFAGGPFNNYVMHAIATVVSQLREQSSSTAMVWANGGYATKHSFGIYSANPPETKFRHASPQDAIDVLPKKSVVTGSEAAGEVTIEAYTVIHERNGLPQKICASLVLDDQRRAWGYSTDPHLGSSMCENEWVGKRVHLDDAGEILVDSD